MNKSPVAIIAPEIIRGNRLCRDFEILRVTAVLDVIFGIIWLSCRLLRLSGEVATGNAGRGWFTRLFQLAFASLAPSLVRRSGGKPELKATNPHAELVFQPCRQPA
jgi:hypothetical protein